MRVLALVHGENVGPSLFGDVVRELGHELDEWDASNGSRPPASPDAYDAMLVFGGRMHPHEVEQHPWLRDEGELLRRLLAGGVPVFGVCLGGQMLARAAGAAVTRARQPEQGWTQVELTPAAAEDPVFHALPQQFHAFQSHLYAFDVPADGIELARNRCCSQAFRVGERAWGIQFHPEVTAKQIDRWLADRGHGLDVEALRAETRDRIDSWNELGRTLCSAFLEAAERRQPAAAAGRGSDLP